ncbi:MAG TPA: hypothetical protein VIE47_04040 [Methylocystis sp.]
MTINSRFQPVPTEFEVVATRNTRASLNGCYHGLALVELAGSGRRWLPYFNAYQGRRIGGFHYIPHGGHEPIGLSLMAGRGSELRWLRELEGGVFLGFDPTPEQQVFAELAEMITMRGGDPADVFSGIFPAEWPRVECGLPRLVSNEGVVIEAATSFLPQERARMICLDHDGARYWVLGWPAWKSMSLCRGALLRDAGGVLRRAELFAPDEEIGDCLTARMIDKPDGVMTFAGFEEHATVDQSFVRYEGRRLERLRRLDKGMLGQIARRRD